MVKLYLRVIFVQFLVLLLFSYPTEANRNLQIIGNPQSGVAPLEVSILCVVAGNTSLPSEYVMDFGDGSDPEIVESTAYSHTFVHTYDAGFFKPVCTVRKNNSATSISDPGRIIVAKWQFITGGDIDTSPAIGTDGTVYVGSEDGNLYAIDPETGTEIWRYPAGGPILSSPAIGAGGFIYFSSKTSLLAVNSNGILKWSFNVGDYIFSSPAISTDGRVIYVGSSNGRLYALNATGTMKWQFQTDDKIVSSPAIGHDGIEPVVYVGSLDRNIYALAADNGALKWKFKTNVEVYGSPAIGKDGTIYVGECEVGSALTYRYKFFYINVDGSKRWEFTGQSGFYSSPAIGSDGKIYVGSWDGYLFALNPEGSLFWKVRTSPPADINSSPAVGSNDIVYVGSKNGNFYAFQSAQEDNEREKQDWVFQSDDIIRSSPVIDAEGTIYFGSRDNRLYAINPGNLTPADSSWPMFHRNGMHTGALENIIIPEVISSIPERNNTNVAVQTKTVQVNFSPLMKTSQVDIDSFVLEKKTSSGNEVVDGFAVLDFERYNNSGYHIIAVFNRLNKEDSLEYSTKYFGTINYRASDTDTDQEDKTYSWSFTTEAKPKTGDGSGSGGEIGCFLKTILH